MIFRKNRQKCSPTHFCQNQYRTLSWKKVAVQK
jgi:hypothetical protein